MNISYAGIVLPRYRISWRPTMVASRIVALLMLVAYCWVPAAAQQVLQGADITESALVEALTPAPAPMITRGINAAPAAASKPAKASLLITFETNATVLTASAKRELDIVGRALNTSRLAGASAVREYLVQNQSVRDDRLKAVGKGDREPLNSSNPAAPENRRVVFVNMSH